jgi:chorismatase
MWNYVSRINEDDVNHMERYKSFSYGRAISFLKNNPVPENLRFPAATGIGSLAGDLDIYFLASSLPRYIHLENPRQVSAYHYPKQYGPKSPSFARATYYKRGKEIFNMYISGTASVRGYETVHKNDIEKQCQTTFGNIEALISQDNLNKYGVTVPVTINATDNVKVYIRNYEDFPIVKKMCDEFFSSTDSILYLKADICRDDLVVEIEGSYLMNLGLRQI